VKKKKTTDAGERGAVPVASWTHVRGKHLARFRLPDGSRPGLGFEGPSSPQGRKRAEEKLAAMFERGLVEKLTAANLEKREKAGDLTTCAVTIARIVPKWCALIERSDLAPSTKQSHLTNARGRITERFGTSEPGTLQTGDLRTWLRELQETLSTSRTRSVFFTLAKMLDDAIAENWLDCINPCRHPKVQERVPAVHIPDDSDKARHTEAEAARLLACLEPSKRLRYAISFTSGVRLGELLGLTWGSIVERDGVICYAVKQALAKEGDEGPNTLRKPKTQASKRHTPVHPAVLAELQRYRASAWPARSAAPPPTPTFFTDAEGGSRSATGPRKSFAPTSPPLVSLRTRPKGTRTRSTRSAAACSPSWSPATALATSPITSSGTRPRRCAGSTTLRCRSPACFGGFRPSGSWTAALDTHQTSKGYRSKSTKKARRSHRRSYGMPQNPQHSETLKTGAGASLASASVREATRFPVRTSRRSSRSRY